MINKKRLGIIEISYDNLEEFWFSNRDFVPRSIEMQTRNRTYKLLGFSHHFRELTNNEIIPSYEYVLSKDIRSGITLLLEVKELK